MATILTDAMCINSIRCWSDSKVALTWVKGEHQEWKQFVQNRVDEMRRLVPASAWSYCSTLCSPADLPSRGVSPSNLTSSIWFIGPTWLSKPQDKETQQAIPSSLDPEDSPDIKAELKGAKVTTLVATGKPATDQPSIGKVIDGHRFSCLTKLLRVNACVLRFVARLKGPQPDTVDGTLSADDIHHAEMLWIQDAQHIAEMNPKFERWRKQVGISKDSNEIWRCGGRLQIPDITYNQTHPVLLDNDHPFTRLVVVKAHSAVHHNGVKDTLTELQSKFWIIQGRQFVRIVIGQCCLCRRLESVSYATQPYPPLPDF